MKNRNLFLLIVVVFLITPAIYYFISGKNNDGDDIRNILVAIQAIAGFALLIIFGRKNKINEK